MIPGKFRFALAAAALATVSLSGCGSAARVASPEEARETLCQALDAWKAGATPAAFREESGVVVIEPQWQQGARLLEYKIVGDGQSSGFDWQCKAQLSLQLSGGRKSREQAVYNVSTDPARVVARGEGPG